MASSKDDLMSSLMGGPAASADEAVVEKQQQGLGGEDSLFGDDIVDEPPPLAMDGPPVGGTVGAGSSTGILSSLVADSNNANSLFDTDDVLFGNDESPIVAPPVVTGPPPVPPPASAPPPPVPAPSKASMLEESGLLGFASAVEHVDAATAPSAIGGGGGLFDDIDQEAENEERMRQERVRFEAAEQERQRQAAAAEAAEQQRRKQEEESAELARKQYQEQLYQQNLQDQMQSIHLGGPSPPMSNGYGVGYNNVSSQMSHSQYQQPHQQQQQSVEEPPVTYVATDFYRDHQPANTQSNNVNPSNNSMYASNNLQHQQQIPPQQQQQQPRYYQPQQPGNYAAGLHNTDMSRGGPNLNNSMIRPPSMIHPTQPPPPIQDPVYGKVIVSEPILIQSDSLFGIRQPPHWSYQIATEILPQQPNSQGGVWLVRRRFRHVVSLEDRLRDDCPGAILPPRPDKHATRAIEEASSSQSVDFAMQRTAELQVYLNELVHHPICFKSPILRLFLALQDDLGIAWAECSGNALTRLANAGVGAAMKVSETSSASKLPWQSEADDIGGGEDNAELLGLQSAESIRMGMVQQAVPKLEGAVTLLREHAEQSGATGMELSRLVKELQASDIELAQPVDIVSAGMLRSGRRSKRLAIELAAAIHSYQQHYKMCRYEKFAFQDRKNALQRRHKERMKADQRAAHLLMHQRAAYGGAGGPYQQQQQIGYPYGDRIIAQEAATADLYATDAWNEADEIGQRLKQEVHRTSWNRRNEWTMSLKIIASSMKEAVTERVGIWETVQENFLLAFPEYREERVIPPASAAVVNGSNVAQSIVIEGPNNSVSPTT